MWVGACGLMSGNAKHSLFSKTISAGISRSQIFSKRVFSLMATCLPKPSFRKRARGELLSVNFVAELEEGQEMNSWLEGKDMGHRVFLGYLTPKTVMTCAGKPSA